MDFVIVGIVIGCVLGASAIAVGLIAWFGAAGMVASLTGAILIILVGWVLGQGNMLSGRLPVIVLVISAIAAAYGLT